MTSPHANPQNACKSGDIGADRIRTGVSIFENDLQAKSRGRSKRLQIDRKVGETWDHWRFRVIHDRGGKCERCPTTEPLQLHHITYERQGLERASDIVVLCHRCHADEHRRLRHAKVDDLDDPWVAEAMAELGMEEAT